MASSLSSVINLDVGGIKYKTSRATLVSCPESMLAAMFRGGDSDLPPASITDDGSYFIDGDGHMFQYVLSYLRTKTVTLPDDWDASQYRKLRAEAQYYQIQGLMQQLDECIHSQKQMLEQNNSQKQKEFILMRAIKWQILEQGYFLLATGWELFAKYNTLLKMGLVDERAPVPVGEYTTVRIEKDPREKINQMGFLEMAGNGETYDGPPPEDDYGQGRPDLYTKFFKCDAEMVQQIQQKGAKPTLGFPASINDWHH